VFVFERRGDLSSITNDIAPLGAYVRFIGDYQRGRVAFVAQTELTDRDCGVNQTSFVTIFCRKPNVRAVKRGGLSWTLKWYNNLVLDLRKFGRHGLKIHAQN